MDETLSSFASEARRAQLRSGDTRVAGGAAHRPAGTPIIAAGGSGARPACWADIADQSTRIPEESIQESIQEAGQTAPSNEHKEAAINAALQVSHPQLVAVRAQFSVEGSEQGGAVLPKGLQDVVQEVDEDSDATARELSQMGHISGNAGSAGSGGDRETNAGARSESKWTDDGDAFVCGATPPGHDLPDTTA